MNHFCKLSAALLFLLTACSVANATPLTPGGNVTPGPIVTLPTQYLGYIGNASFVSQAPAGMSPTIGGTYSTAVYKDGGNALCGSLGNCLSFAIQVTNSATSSDGIETITTGPFSNSYLYNVGYIAASGVSAPISVSDSSSGAIAFHFTQNGIWTNMITPGSTSDVIVIQTSATNFTAGNISFQDNQTATVAGFIPAFAVTPEPSSLVLLGSGMLGTAGAMLRRRRTAA